MMKNPESGSILICLPTFREEQSIERMIDQITSLGYPLVVTDGGSDDQTIYLAQNKGIEVLLRRGEGKGAGVRQVLNYAKQKGYDGVGFLDCDLTYPVSSIPELEIAFRNGADMVVGCRPFSKIVFLNRLANLLFTQAINLLFFGRLTDSQSGMRILRTNCFNNVLKSSGFDIETEISCFALKNKLVIQELKVDYHERVGESKVSIWDAFVILRRIMLERFR
jgi:glycosyltransferase involved in cell wall biosynthesis